MDKKVSLIIPVWNGENYLAEAIESALQQDYPNKEVIVVDDGSTDGTQNVIETFKSRILSLKQKNKGLGASRNTGIRASQGEYLAFLDHDDLWERTKISAQMKAMDEFGSLDPLIFSEVKQFICPRLSEEERKKISVNESNLPGYFAGTLLISRSRFEQIGFFLEEKLLGEFVDWYLRATEKNIPMITLNEITLYRRVHQHNMGRQKEQYSRTDYLKILKNSLTRRRSIA